ncbi:MAG: hypothetical protein CMA12_06615 [Euryarchaeota archaeon]|nr:hypothetical protein [Euryarchaeota archaeon]OUW22115.1 MAG: hypothetical protein CBD33_03575 [Euryarchaeota archaeon TMED173]|tara:strand:- start:652 stop:1302 length:651 start_codon:yes stop_codon:yes gene_type:complete
MRNVLILGNTLDALSAAHYILDTCQNIKIQLVAETAEIGLSVEAPGIFEKWPPCPTHWISDMKSQTPTKESTAVRRSWFEKALGIQLSNRGCTIHLKTRTSAISPDQIQVVGAGAIGMGTIHYDAILDFRHENIGPEWFGGTLSSGLEAPGEISGVRSDGTTEVWINEEGNRIKNWIQTATWNGEDPRNALVQDIEEGIFKARTKVDTIIQSSDSR